MIITMTLREKNQNFAQKHATLLTPLLLALLSYFGVTAPDQYEKLTAVAPAEQSVTVNVESVPEAMLNRTEPLTEKEIQAMIDAAIKKHQNSKRYHEFDG